MAGKSSPSDWANGAAPSRTLATPNVATCRSYLQVAMLYVCPFPFLSFPFLSFPFLSFPFPLHSLRPSTLPPPFHPPPFPQSTHPCPHPTQSTPTNPFQVFQWTQDNPGIWPFHCHIAWHVSGGLYANIMERPADIKNLRVPSTTYQNCRDWAAHSGGDLLPQIDSGL